MKVLVTGGTGYLGGWVLKSLKDKGVEQIVSCSSRAVRPSFEAEHIQLNLASPKDVRPVLDRIQPDVVIHLAAVVRHSRRFPGSDFKINVLSSHEIATYCSNNSAQLVFLSTSGTIGCSQIKEDAPDEDANFSTAVQNWPYYQSKVCVEDFLQLSAQANPDFRFSVIRPPVMLGPEDTSFRTTHTLSKVMNQKLPFIIDGEMHYVDVRDVASLVVDCALRERTERIINCPGRRLALKTFFDEACIYFDVKPCYRSVPYPVAISLSHLDHFASGLLGRDKLFVPDPVQVEMANHYWGISSQYDFAPHRDLKQTLKETCEWLKSVS